MIWYDMIKKGWKFESNRIANRNTDRKKRDREEIGSVYKQIQIVEMNKLDSTLIWRLAAEC